MRKDKLKDLFSYHAPNDDQKARMDKIRDLGYQLAELINSSTMTSSEQTKAIRHVESAVMWANKAVVVNEDIPKIQPLEGPVFGDEPE